MAKKQNYTFRFDPDIIEKIDKIARKKHRSRTNLIEVILAAYIRENDKTEEDENKE